MGFYLRLLLVLVVARRPASRISPTRSRTSIGTPHDTQNVHVNSSTPFRDREVIVL
jgi:hypothetical protein